MKTFATAYGYFDKESNEYVITRPDTPRPWINVICPGDYGLTISQTGGGYSWLTHASLNRLTRWDQDLIRDDSGKFFYARDDESGEIWSLTWKPVCRTPDAYQVAHGMGYSRFTSRNLGILSEVTVFVPPGSPGEVWQVSLKNDSARDRRISLFSYLEWLLGAAPDSHREFHKVFLETEFDPERNAIWATKRLWELPDAKGRHWNRDWEYFAFHSVSQKVAGFETDKENFLGMYGSLREPASVRRGELNNSYGRWGDAMASLHNAVVLKPGEIRTLTYLIGAVKREERTAAEAMIAEYLEPGAAARALAATGGFWEKLLATTAVETPDEGFDLMVNRWLKYQSISGHIWGRTAYYQTGGAYGFRDQLQASQLFLHIDPSLTAKQIRLHAAQQYADGHVRHWWHPISDQGMENRISDNLLWLPYVVMKYLKETGDMSLLDEAVPFRDAGEASIFEHCRRAIEFSLARRSPRGLPLIGDGDWNDGLNAVGAEGQGESVWLAEFLYGILKDFGKTVELYSGQENAERYLKESDNFKRAVNEYAWDGEWFFRATTDDGEIIGSKNNDEGRIFLNAQVWAIINEITDQVRTEKAYRSMEELLFRQYGPLLLYPAYQRPHREIGYLSRYAPGIRENGGVYTHAANWAVLAACKMGRKDQALALFNSYLPSYRGMDPDLYKAEPYVTPGNVDGPDSPNFGRGGWTWYSGSSAWAYLVAVEGILGISPTWEGLRIAPVIPDRWDGFTMRRPYRGASYEIKCRREPGRKGLFVDGIILEGDTVPPHRDGKLHLVEVLI